MQQQAGGEGRVERGLVVGQLLAGCDIEAQVRVRLRVSPRRRDHVGSDVDAHHLPAGTQVGRDQTAQRAAAAAHFEHALAGSAGHDIPQRRVHLGLVGAARPIFQEGGHPGGILGADGGGV